MHGLNCAALTLVHGPTEYYLIRDFLSSLEFELHPFIIIFIELCTRYILCLLLVYLPKERTQMVPRAHHPEKHLNRCHHL
jgi:hypothetical protein